MCDIWELEKNYMYDYKQTHSMNLKVRKKKAMLTFSLSWCFLSALSAAATASRSAAEHIPA